MKNRWFRVIADRFDWTPRYGVMKAYRRGQIDFGTERCVNYGLSIGAIELISKPKNAKVDKSGKVIWNAD